jgi:tRNA G10  N-methylase Trm11
MRQLSLPMLLPRQRGVELNKVEDADRPAHGWYRFVLSFPPHLVRDYVQRFGLEAGQCVLDPFCGTGTTVVECKKLGIRGIGVEAHPMSHFASSVKVNWSPDAEGFERSAVEIANGALEDVRLVEAIFHSH